MDSSHPKEKKGSRMSRPLRRFWRHRLPWYAGRLVESTGNIVRIGVCRIDVQPAFFSTFQKGCLLLGRYERSERNAIARFLDPDLPLIDLGASIGVTSCLSNRILRFP